MKDAYSNLLGEYVQAHQVDHVDIDGFQIVCPCCREDIFKVVRETEDKVSTFFSHYRASVAFSVAECERRVGSLTASEKAEASNLSRARTVAMLRSVIRDAVALLPIDGSLYDESKFRKSLPLHMEVVNGIREIVGELGPAGLLSDVVHINDMAIQEMGHTNLTPFGMSYRNRIAGDLVRTIFANTNSPKTIIYMTARAHHAAFRERGMSPNGMLHYDLRSRSRKLADHEGLKKEHGSPSQNPFRMTAYTTLDAMLRELHRLPYLKMIANAQAKRPPLDGISIDDYLPDLEDAQPAVNYKPLHGIQLIATPVSS